MPAQKNPSPATRRAAPAQRARRRQPTVASPAPVSSATGSLPAAPAAHAEAPTARLDRLLHAAAAPWTGGLSPISLSLALVDWAWHLGVSPGRQMELAARAAQSWRDTLRVGGPGDPQAAAADDDPRFRDEAWAAWPFNLLRSGFHNAEVFWREAAVVPGMTAQHARQTQFFARQWLGLLTPANWLATNPVVLREAVASGGQRLVDGARNWLEDVAASYSASHTEPPAPARYRIGRDVAATPGAVVFRNRLIELIRYDPVTPRVRPEPLLMIPSWIMKYYILDLSPHNSMARWFVGQGHTVYMLSWRNPERSDHDLSLDDYLRLGVLDALRAVGRIEGAETPVHAMGYCLGGTLLAIAAAALARSRRPSDCADLPPLATLTLLAAQTDFSEPGELGLFIDESQVGFLDDITRGQGYLSGEQMAGSFQFLHSRELVWTRRMREYLMGEREQPSDLMAWNADHTRMPARMHHEYLVALYLRNALATGSYRVEGQAVSLADIRAPLFVVGTERDHVSPWHSVYKLHHLCDAEISFVLTSGGHNAGVVSEPGHPNRHYRLATRAAHGAWIEPEVWLQQTPAIEGSWWTAWQAWLAARSTAPTAARATAADATLGKAPGAYVLRRFRD